jgi:hypothetical protein
MVRAAAALDVQHSTQRGARGLLDLSFDPGAMLRCRFVGLGVPLSVNRYIYSPASSLCREINEGSPACIVGGSECDDP